MTTEKAWGRRQLGEALIQALGLPKNTAWLELRVAANEPVSVRCGYFPDALTETEGRKVCGELKTITMREVPSNVQIEGAARLLAQLPSNAGLGVAVPPAPTFEKDE